MGLTGACLTIGKDHRVATRHPDELFETRLESGTEVSLSCVRLKNFFWESVPGLTFGEHVLRVERDACVVPVIHRFGDSCSILVMAGTVVNSWSDAAEDL